MIEVKRVYIDTDNTDNMMFYEMFKELGIPKESQGMVSITLYGFTWNVVQSLGIISLMSIFGAPPKSRSLMVDYIVIRDAFAYNMLSGRRALMDLKTIFSSLHVSMKFPMKSRVPRACGDVPVAYSCYVVDVTRKLPVNQVSQDELVLEPQEKLETEDAIEDFP